MKQCRRCKEKKPLKEFYVHQAMLDGYLNFCKECVKKRVKNHRIKNVKQIRQYDRKRRSPENLSKKEKSERVDRCREWRSQDKRRQIAHNTTARELREEKPDRCAICGNRSSVIHGHHEDYNKPFEVIWCCPVCHKELHKLAPIV